MATQSSSNQAQASLPTATEGFSNADITVKIPDITTTYPNGDIRSGHRVCDPHFTCFWGSCYTGLNGVIGCCTIESCFAKTTCIPNHTGFEPCNEDTDGCTYCANPEAAYCATLVNQQESQTIFGCSSASDYTVTSAWENTVVSNGYTALLPLTVYTPASLRTSKALSTPTSTVSITSTGTTTQSTGPTKTQTTLIHEVLDTGGIAGAVVGSAVGLVAIIIFLIWLVNRYRRKQSHPAGDQLVPETWLNPDEDKSHETATGIPPTPSEDGHALQMLDHNGRPTVVSPELPDTAMSIANRELPGSPGSIARLGLGNRSVYGRSDPGELLGPPTPYIHTQASYSDPGVDGTGDRSSNASVYCQVMSRSQPLEEHTQGLSVPRRIPSKSSGFQIIRSSSPYNAANGVSPISAGGHYPTSTPASPQLYSRASSSHSNSQQASFFNRSASPDQAKLNDRPPLRSVSRPSSIYLVPQVLHVSGPSTPHSPYSASSTASAHLPEVIPRTQYSINGGRPVERPVSARDEGLSARGDWSGWVSPELALSQGLWEAGTEETDSKRGSGARGE